MNKCLKEFEEVRIVMEGINAKVGDESLKVVGKCGVFGKNENGECVY